MKYQIIEKYAQQNLVINFVKGWEDKDGNIPIVVNVSGKKFGLVKLKDSGDWYYWLGIGSGGATRDMPAGRGDYLIGQKLEQTLASKLDLLISSGVNLEKFSSSGASWTPSNQSELEFLAKLIDRIGQINDFLSQNGLLYTGGDKAIYGEDITGDDILSAKVKTTPTPQNSPSRPSGDSESKESYWRDKFYSTTESQIGVPYYWGGNDPGTGFDCSGLIYWALNKSGMLPGIGDMVAGDQLNLGKVIGEKDLQKGDFIGFKTDKGVVHIGLYSGIGTSYLSASGGGRNTKGDNPKAKVQVTDYTKYPAEKIFVSISPIIEKRMRNS
jgi:cell wall-associated NlpC family hydrolase